MTYAKRTIIMVNKLLAILKHISEIIAEGSSGRSVLQEIVVYLAESLEVEVCSIYIHDKPNNELVLKATFGLSEDSIDTVRMVAGEGLTGYSFVNREIMNLQNPDEHPEFLYFGQSGEEEYHSFLSIPLKAGGVCVGILVIQRKVPKKFMGPVVDMAKSLSSQLAHLIINTNIIKELSEEKNKESELPEMPAQQILLRGFPLNTGIASGKAHLFIPDLSMENIEHVEITDVPGELKLFDSAVQMTKEKTIELEQTAFSVISEVDASIFNVHLLFLDDKAVIDAVKKDISDNSHCAEFSIKQVFLSYQKQFLKIEDQVFREKIYDLKDVMLRLCETLKEINTGIISEDADHMIRSNRIIVANELLPSDLMKLPFGKIDGIVCRKGGIAAHAAILAQALNLPAVMGVKGAMKQIKDGDDLILDSFSGIVYVNPDEMVSSEFSNPDNLIHESHEDTPAERGPAFTIDRSEVTLRANISLLCETDLLEKYGASGIGLYRTEFLYMIRDYFPTEDEQFEIFKKIVEAGKGEEVTVRVLDVGADKMLNYMNIPFEENPALGNRGIRLLLSNRILFKEHMRAVLRAGFYGRLRLNFPMVTTQEELLLIKQILKEVENDLHKGDIQHSEDYKVGIMLEVPAAVMGIRRLIDHVDFMSIGSNDLQQYAFAVDRTNADVANLANPLHPVFLEMLLNIGDTLKDYPEKELSICGEMAGNPLAVPFIIGAGITDLSMPPVKIPGVRKVISKLSTNEFRKMIETAVTFNNPGQVKEYVLQQFNEKGIQI